MVLEAHLLAFALTAYAQEPTCDMVKAVIRASDSAVENLFLAVLRSETTLEKRILILQEYLCLDRAYVVCELADPEIDRKLDRSFRAIQNVRASLFVLIDPSARLQRHSRLNLTSEFINRSACRCRPDRAKRGFTLIRHGYPIAILITSCENTSLHGALIGLLQVSAVSREHWAGKTTCRREQCQVDESFSGWLLWCPVATPVAEGAVGATWQTWREVLHFSGCPTARLDTCASSTSPARCRGIASSPARSPPDLQRDPFFRSSPVRSGSSRPHPSA